MIVIPAKAGIQDSDESGFRIKCGMTAPQITSDKVLRMHLVNKRVNVNECIFWIALGLGIIISTEMRRLIYLVLIINLLGCIKLFSKQSWLEKFQYRMPLHFNLSVDQKTNLIDHQIKLDIQGIDPKAPLCVDFTRIELDGADIKFTDTDGKTPVNFWIQSWNNERAQATVWIKIPEIIPHQPKTIYLYYTNPGAKSASSFVETMTKLIPDQDTLGLWHFDEPEDAIQDSSRHKHQCASYQMHRWGRDGYWPEPYQQLGDALVFNGQDDYVKIVLSPELSFKEQYNLSLEAWVYPTSYTSHATILTKEGEYYFQVNQSGNLGCYLYGPKPETYYYSKGIVPLNQWSHIALTYDGQTIRFYINEKLDTGIEAKGAIMPCLDKVHGIDYKSSFLWLGNYRAEPGFAWNGMLDEVRILKRTLALEEIQAGAEYRKYIPGKINIETGKPQTSTEWKKK